MGHSGQSFLGRMTNESSGQITEAVRPTAVRQREIGQGQGLPPPGSPENLPVHCGPQNTTCHSQARGVHTRPRCLDVMECVRGPTTALAKPYSTHGRSSSQARGPKRQPGLALGWGWRFVQLKPWDWAPRSQEKVMAASSTYRGKNAKSSHAQCHSQSPALSRAGATCVTVPGSQPRLLPPSPQQAGQQASPNPGTAKVKAKPESRSLG